MATSTIVTDNKVISATPSATSGSIDTSLSRIYRQGRVVTMTSIISGAEVSSNWGDIMTIQAEYRPAMTYTIMGNVGINSLVQARVNPGGTVQIRGEAATNQTVRVIGSWIV